MYGGKIEIKTKKKGYHKGESLISAKGTFFTHITRFNV